MSPIRYAVCLLVFIITAQAAFGQKDTVYFNDVWKYTDRNHAMYYRVIKKQDDGRYAVTDHFLDGTIQMKGTYLHIDTPDSKYRDGLFTYYNTEGKVMSDGKIVNGKHEGVWTYFFATSGLTSSQYNYKNDMLEGDVTFYDSVTQDVKTSGHYSNDDQSGKWIYRDTKGRIKEERFYSKIKGDVVGAATVYNTEGKKKAEGNVIKNNYVGLWKFYDEESGEITYEKTYINDELDGPLKGFYPGGKLRRKETYSFGKMTSGTCYNKEGKEITFFPAWTAASPSVDIGEFLGANMIYPEQARDNNIQGRVLVEFIVNEQGKLTNPEVLEGLGGGCNEEAIRIILAMPNWKPAMEEGKPVKVYYTLPIRFKLTD